MSINFEQDAQGIVTLTIDMPGRSMNVINSELEGPLEAALSRIEQAPDITGIILTSGKESFVAGADIEGLFHIKEPLQAFELAQQLKATLFRLERCGRPVVCAMPGTALGGGLEIALACHYRIAIDHPKARFGLPEVKLGLLPGGGGTQRLPRLIGIQAALPLLLEGKELKPAKALAAGILDALASDRADLLAQARAWISANPKARARWDDRKFRIPGGDSKHPANVQMWAIAPSMLRQKTQGLYPAPQNILSCVFEGCLLDIETGCEIESRYFAELAVGQVCKNTLSSLWFQLNDLKKGAARPAGVKAPPFQRVGILGAGMMGAGIAWSCARAGFDVVLKDLTLEGAEKGRSHSQKLADKAVQRRQMTPDQAAALLSRIHASASVDDLAGCDLIIEAVFEDRELKAAVTRESEAVMDAQGVFASNTSTLPITGLASQSTRPAQFIGLHFFSPVEKMPLVEIIVGKQTSPETLARAFDFVLAIRKTPIVVNDARGFYTSRVFGTYVMEGMALLAEGMDPNCIEAAGRASGMPMPPLALQDEVSLSLAWHVAEQTRKDLAAAGDPYSPHPGLTVIDKMVNSLGREGKKSGRGFYDYEAGNKQLWPGLKDHWPPADAGLSQQDMIDRMLYAQALETVRCVEEGVVTRCADANIGSIFGWGFAPWSGGCLQFINAIGLEPFIARAEELAGRFGERFAPPPLLHEMAHEGRSFE